MTAARQGAWEHEVDVVDMVAELTRPYQHREHYTTVTGATSYGRDHVTKTPSLIHQLQHAAPTGEGLGRGGGYESRPVARLEALDALTRIDLEAARWVRNLGDDDPGSTTACLRRLSSLLPSTQRCGSRSKMPGCCTWHEIERDVRRWWTQARIVTGWDQPAWRPDSTCPGCGVRGSLRIRLEDRAGLCVECRETWDASSYQVLADHVRSEAEERRRPDVEPVEIPPGQNRGW